MLVRVPVLDVEQQQIGPVRHPVKDLRRGIAGGLNGRMDAPHPQLGEQSGGKVGLGQDLAPGQSHAAAALLVKVPVLEADRYRLLHGHLLPVLGQGDPVFQLAGGRTLALRIGAPFAPQRTALQKDHRADTRAVVKAEFLDVEHNPSPVFHRTRHLFSI